MTDNEYPVIEPDLQIAFHYRLQELREQYLGEALQATVAGLDVPELDDQLAAYVPPRSLSRVASFSLRAEVLFPVPLLLQANPCLLGYYRLLYGLSQKELYGRGRFGPFRSMEERGTVSTTAGPRLPALCRSLVGTGDLLLEGIDELSLSAIDDLQLLTIGAFLRGSRLNLIGQEAVREVHSLIASIATKWIQESSAREIAIRNASGREVVIAFAGDPDVAVRELAPGGEQLRVSIEIKGGKDGSNKHNRLGEAEKSHLKARQVGCSEFWTILRTSVTASQARAASPTTTHFFQLDRITDPTTAEHQEFKERLCVVLGIPVQ